MTEYTIAQLRQMVSGSDDAMLLVDPDWICIAINQKASDDLLIPIEEAINSKIQPVDYDSIQVTVLGKDHTILIKRLEQCCQDHTENSETL